MGFDEGRVIFENSDNGAFYAGQTVLAKLVFDQDKVKTFRGIYAKIKGFCEVHWTSRKSKRVRDGRGGYRTEHYTITHESHEVYVEKKIFLIGGESGEHKLQPGHHEFPFKFHLPDNCPSAYEGEYGHIRYEIKVVVDRSFKLDQEKKIQLRVVAPLDLNDCPDAHEPIEIDFSESYSCCCSRSGVCETVVKLPKSGYCPGQVIPIEVSCSNNGNVEIETITFEINQDFVFHATSAPGTKYSEATIAKLKKGPVPGNTTRNWTLEMTVPTMDVYNFNSCQYIDVTHEFKVKVSPDGCHTDSKESREFNIGTVPLQGYQDDVPNPMADQMPKQNMGLAQSTPHYGPVVTQPMPYPAPSPYPGGNPYPGANQPYPGANPPYPGSNPPYPGANPPYPGSNPPYPGGNPPYPGANPPYPGANPPYPGANPPYPGANPPYPGANPPYPGANPPYPGPAHPPYPGAAQPVSPYPPAYPGSGPAAPLLPAGAAVPYPTGPASPFANASAPGAMPPTPDSDNNKNPMGDATIDPPYNPNYKG